MDEIRERGNVKAEAPTNGSTPNGSDGAAAPRRRRPLVWAVLAVVVLVAGFLGIRYALWSSGHEATDDASLTTDTVQIAPQVSGTVLKVLVDENDSVRAGQPLVLLDDSTYRAAVAQAQANLDAAVAQAKGAGVTVGLTQQTGGAQEVQAQGALARAESGVESARADAARAAAAVTAAAAQARSAEAGAEASGAGIAAARANRDRLSAAYAAAKSQVEAARASVTSAQAAVTAAAANAQKAERDAHRYDQLVAQGAVSQQMAEQARNADVAAKAALDVAREQVASARAMVQARQSDAAAAAEQLRAADTAITQARAQAAAAAQAASAARSSVDQARAQSAAVRQSIAAAQAQRQQAEGGVAAAAAAPRQVAVSRTAHEQALARIEQARAALQQAKLQLSYTRIVAPVAGRVSKDTVEVGSLVQPGTPLMAIVGTGKLWVVANFKETQLHGIEAGNRAEVDVDAVPSHVFTGRVQSISAATGSTFALLPADNATGNFTKVVQRIPVKIVLDPGQPDVDRLRAGMSVTAVVESR